MAEMTIDQQRALALARARSRLKQGGPSASEQISKDAITQEAEATKDASPAGFALDTLSEANRMTRPVREAVYGAATSTPWGAAARDFDAVSGFAQNQIERGAYNAGGKVTDLLANKVSPENAARTGFAVNVAAQAIPTILSGELMRGALEQPSRMAARSLMKSALKPGKAMHIEKLPGTNVTKADSAVEIMLQGGANVSEGGIRKLATARDRLSKMIDNTINMSNAKINKNAVAQRAKSLLNDFYIQLGDSSGDVRAIERAIERFKAGISGEDIPVKLAQQMKRATDRVLGDVYGKSILKPASTEAQKALRLAVKEEIANQVPEVDRLNRAQQKVLNAMEILQGRQGIAANTNPLGLSWLAENPLAAAGFAFDKSSLAKSALANLLYRGTIPWLLGTGGGGILASQSGSPPNK